MKNVDQLALAWLALSCGVTFLLFGWDKFRAGRSGNRVPEFQLALWAALGGWPAGLIAMRLFRHKTAKRTFWVKYAVALLVWVALAYGYWKIRA